MAGLDQSVDRDNGILDYARLNDITLQAWSPFQKGFFDGVFIGDRDNYGALNDALDEIASAHGVTPTGSRSRGSPDTPRTSKWCWARPTRAGGGIRGRL